MTEATKLEGAWALVPDAITAWMIGATVDKCPDMRLGFDARHLTAHFAVPGPGDTRPEQFICGAPTPDIVYAEEPKWIGALRCERCRALVAGGS